MQLSFPRQYHLRTKSEFKSIFDKSNRISQKHLLILFKQNQKEYSRLGVIVGKRVAKKAIARNRIRRIVKESFRLNQEKLLGWDIIVIARQQCDTLNKPTLRKGIDDLWQKLQNQYRGCLFQ